MKKAHAGVDRRSVAVLQAVRGGYGLLQLAAPTLVADRLLHRRLDTRGRLIARVLGARQLGQAAVSGPDASHTVLVLGVGVDVLHALSMLGLAAIDRRRRATASLDALIAAGFAVAGGFVARPG